MAKAKVENIVATTAPANSLDLTTIAMALEGAEYEPEQFPGLVYRIDKTKTVLLLFQTGKIICTGAKHIEDMEIAINKLKDNLNI